MCSRCRAVKLISKFVALPLSEQTPKYEGSRMRCGFRSHLYIDGVRSTKEDQSHTNLRSSLFTGVTVDSTPS